MRWSRPLPAELPARVHKPAHGAEHIAWSGELRAVVDDEQLVIRVWSRKSQTWRYFIEWRYEWEEGRIQPGPLPRRYHRDDDVEGPPGGGWPPGSQP